MISKIWQYIAIVAMLLFAAATVRGYMLSVELDAVRDKSKIESQQFEIAVRNLKLEISNERSLAVASYAALTDEYRAREKRLTITFESERKATNEKLISAQRHANESDVVGKRVQDAYQKLLAGHRDAITAASTQASGGTEDPAVARERAARATLDGVLTELYRSEQAAAARYAHLAEQAYIRGSSCEALADQGFAAAYN